MADRTGEQNRLWNRTIIRCQVNRWHTFDLSSLIMYKHYPYLTSPQSYDRHEFQPKFVGGCVVQIIYEFHSECQEKSFNCLLLEIVLNGWLRSYKKKIISRKILRYDGWIHKGFIYLILSYMYPYKYSNASHMKT